MLSINIDDVVTVTINNKLLNIHNTQDILHQLKSIALEHKQNIVINLINVESLDSSTIAMFVEYNNFLKESRRELTFINLSPFVKKIFEMLHISKFFKIQ